MQPHPVKRAVLKLPDGRERTLLLVHTDKASYVWQTPEGRVWEDLSVYADEATAIRMLRVGVDSDPALVGVDLTVYPMDPPPAERLAKRLSVRYGPWKETEVEECAKVIAEETALPELLDKTQTLLAYIFKNRLVFAMAVCPPTPGAQPRDLTMDGCLLEAIQAIEKSTGLKLDRLTSELMKPVSAIIAPGLQKGSKAVQ